MTGAPSDDALDIELELMLRTYEGPETPSPRRRRPRWRRVALAIGGAALLAAVGIAVGLRADGDRRGAAALDAPGACRTLELEGRRYVARAAPARTLVAGERLARPGTLLCAGGRRSVALARIAGIDPSVAVVRPGVPGRVYAAEGRCPGSGGAALLACLRGSSPAP